MYHNLDFYHTLHSNSMSITHSILSFDVICHYMMKYFINIFIVQNSKQKNNMKSNQQ